MSPERAALLTGLVFLGLIAIAHAASLKGDR